MGTGFHDLEVWRDAKSLAVATYRATTGLKDFSLRDQIRRAAVSVPSNIAEGDERDTDKDGLQFFYIAKGSLAELRTQIEIGVEVGLISTADAGPLLTAAATLARRLGALIKSRTHVS
jgi:four helix bundle protein